MTGDQEHSTKPVTLSWQFETMAALEQVWEAISDTDRLNEIAAFQFHFEEGGDQARSTLGTGRTRRLGAIDVAWNELPFRFSPGKLRSMRIFDGSPAEHMTFQIQLGRTPTGTTIHYELSIYPRSAWQRPLVVVDTRMFVAPRLEATLKGLVDYLEGRHSPWRDGPPPLDAHASHFLEMALAQVQPPAFAQALSRILREEPLRTQDQIHPLRLGRKAGVSDAEAVDGFISAVNEGILQLQWDMMCPSCRAPRVRANTLSDIPRSVHCASCDVTFDGSFPDSVVVTGRPSPRLRRYQLEIQCLGSPARTPHFVMQDVIEPGSSLNVELPLAVGPYRLRVWPGQQAASIEVEEGAKDQKLSLTVGPSSVEPVRRVVQPGLVALELHNNRTEAVTLVVEKRWRPDDLLTAGHLLESPGAGRLLPEEVLDGELESTTLRCAVLVVEPTREETVAVRAHLERWQPRILRVSDRTILATFVSVSQALDVARDMATSHRLYCALNVGPVVELRLGEGIVPMGRTVDDTFSLMRCVAADVLAIPLALELDEEVRQVLGAAGLPDRTPHLPSGSGPAARWKILRDTPTPSP